MSVKEGAQKVISVRLNLAREDEKKLYNEVMSHNRRVPGDIYGSAGAYVKAALAAYSAGREEEEREYHLKKQMEDFLERLSREQATGFMKQLEEHDKKLTETILSVMQNVFVSLLQGKGTQTVFSEKWQKNSVRSEQQQVERIREDTGADDDKTKDAGSVERKKQFVDEGTQDHTEKHGTDAGTVITRLDAEPTEELPEGARG